MSKYIYLGEKTQTTNVSTVKEECECTVLCLIVIGDFASFRLCNFYPYIN